MITIQQSNSLETAKIREIFAKGVCLSVVHVVVNKTLSNAAIIDNYKCNLKSLQEYHKF